MLVFIVSINGETRVFYSQKEAQEYMAGLTPTPKNTIEFIIDRR